MYILNDHPVLSGAWPHVKKNLNKYESGRSMNHEFEKEKYDLLVRK